MDLGIKKLGNQFYLNPPYDYVQNITINNVRILIILIEFLFNIFNYYIINL